MGYVDLLLMHWPGDWPSDKGGKDAISARHKRKQIWAAIEEIHARGLARSIGVSNFQIRHLEQLLEDCSVGPMVNQIEINPFIRQMETTEFCKKNGIHCVAWSPFGSGSAGIFDNPVIVALAEKYKKNPGQIILRWLIQQGISVLPKSSSESRMRGNLDVCDFTMTSEEIASMNALDKHQSSSMTSDSIL